MFSEILQGRSSVNQLLIFRINSRQVYAVCKSFPLLSLA